MVPKCINTKDKENDNQMKPQYRTVLKWPKELGVVAHAFIPARRRQRQAVSSKPA